jgi:hypothetical protein
MALTAAPAGMNMGFCVDSEPFCTHVYNIEGAGEGGNFPAFTPYLTVRLFLLKINPFSLPNAA